MRAPTLASVMRRKEIRTIGCRKKMKPSKQKKIGRYLNIKPN